MESSVVAKLAELERLSHAALKKHWCALFGSEPPAYGRQFLRRRLAYRIQECAFGGLSEDARTQMEALVPSVESQENQSAPSGTKQRRRKPDLAPPGTRLIREFRDKRYEVVIGESSFEFEGRRYRSLSAIAREITGTQWNGPAFFGLREKSAKESDR
jgi:hypothetical protein